MSKKTKQDDLEEVKSDLDVEQCDAEQPAAEALTPAQLQQALAEKTVEAEEYYQQLLRLQAEFDNFKRRTKQEKADIIEFALEELVVDLLPVLDNFDRALTAVNNPGEDFVSGVDLIYRQLKDILTNRGLEVIPALEEKFDPNHHEAVLQVEDENYVENTVTEELRRGYFLKGKVIRAAMVKVAK